MKLNPQQRQAVLLALVRGLHAAGSWCGETHIQKATYFLQEGCGVPLGFDFILYKHGPYSFDLNDELTALQADRLLAVVPEERYGSHLYPTPAADAYLARFPRSVGSSARALDAVCRQLGAKNVAELERVATALYVARERPGGAEGEHAARICELKPHVSHGDAVAALSFVRSFQSAVG